MPTLGELASRLELEFLGDSAMPIKGIASLDTAGPEHLSFVSEKKHLRRVADTRAGALILHPDWVDRWPGGALLSPAPYVAYAHVSRIFDNHPAASGRVHEKASVAESAQLGEGVTVDVGACVEAGAMLGDRER